MVDSFNELMVPCLVLSVFDSICQKCEQVPTFEVGLTFVNTEYMYRAEWYTRRRTGGEMKGILGIVKIPKYCTVSTLEDRVRDKQDARTELLLLFVD